MRYAPYLIAGSSLVLGALGFLIPSAAAGGHEAVVQRQHSHRVNRAPSSLTRPELKDAISKAGNTPVANSAAFLPEGDRQVQSLDWSPSYQAMSDTSSGLSSFPRNAARVRTENWDE